MVLGFPLTKISFCAKVEDTNSRKKGGDNHGRLLDLEN